MENRRKQLTRDHKRVLPEVAESKIVPEKEMGRAKSEAAGTSREPKDIRKKKSTKERWLLTRKTWRYMADAGRKLIPDGAHNRVEDIPKIESYFQHVCRKEPRFLLWRKSSYPGALGFRSHTRRNRNRKKGGSYREKASSADEAEDLAWNTSMKGATTSREIPGAMIMTPTTSGRFDVQRLRQEFLDSPSTSVVSTSLVGGQRQEKPERPKSFLQKFSLIHSSKTPPSKSPVIEEGISHESDISTPQGTLCLERSQSSLRQEPESPESFDELEELDRKEFIDTLTRYLNQEDEDDDETVLKPSRKTVSEEQRSDIDFQLLLDQLRKNLAAEFSFQRHHERSSTERHHQGGTISTRSNITPSVHFEGDNQQKMLLETLNRYFGKTTKREKMISDLLTDRKLLDKLYSDLRRTRGSRGRSAAVAGSGFTSYLRLSNAGFDRRRESGGERDIDEIGEPSSWKRLSKPSRGYRDGNFSPPPLIEVQHEAEPVFASHGTQTDTLPPAMLAAIEEELRKAREKAREENEGMMSPGGMSRRRSSVDHDDVSPSVSDTIKRYLRMARKKSLDSDKVDRFKRVNYDRNLRNIKPKGEITKPGDDDGLNKGSQSDESWIDAMKELKLDDIIETSDIDLSGGNDQEMFGSLVTSSRSSVDIDDGLLSPASPPHSKGILSSGQSFLSNLLHGLQHSQAAVQPGSVVNVSEKDGAISKHTAVGMQKSKSSSSVVQHGRNLVSKKIWRSRSKSQIRPSAWTPQGQCVWANVDGRQVILTDTTLMELSPLETKELQKVAVAKLHALNLGVSVKIPESGGDKQTSTKPKRRPYLLKRKALTTGFFDTARTKDKMADLDKEKSSGFMFGIPLTQILDNERTKSSRNESPMRSRISSSVEDELNEGLRRQSQHGSHSSFTSFLDTSKPDEESGSCESLMSPSGSVPGLLDTLSASAYDVSAVDKEATVPQIVPMCIKHLETHGLRCSGLFRKFGLKTKVRELKEELDSGRDFELDPETDPLSVASLLKTFLRDLPDPLLCKSLYNAFIRTQKIRNRRLQHEAVQHLVQLLPTPNRDILHLLLNFLVLVSHNAAPFYLPSGEKVPGNDMDSYSLSVVMAPNLLSSMTINPMDLSEEVKAEINDGINVFRSMIDHAQELFVVSADLLNDVYLHLMDSHPEALDILLSKRESVVDDCSEEVLSPAHESGHLDNSSRSLSFLGLDQESVGRHSSAGGSGDVEVEQQVRRVWSREDFLHETAGMGGPDVSMRPRHAERGRGREKSSKKRQQDDQSHGQVRSGINDGGNSPKARSNTDPVIQSTQKQTSSRNQDGEKMRSVSVDSGNVTSTEEITGKLYKVMDDHERRQSSPVVADKSGIITASLKIPVPNSQPFSLNRNDVDIPYIEDGSPEASKQSMTIGVVRSSAIPKREARQRSVSGSDSSQASTVLPATSSAPLVHSYDSAMSSSATFGSPLRNTTPSVCSSSGGEAGLFSSTPSWASTPPTSPDSTVKTVNYIPEDEMQLARFSISAKGARALPDDAQTARFTIPAKGVVGYQRGTSVTAIVAKEIAPVLLQKVTFTSTSELQQLQKSNTSHQKSHSSRSSGELLKSATTSAIQSANKQVEFEQEQRESDRKLTTSISSIGGAVMRSKTEDIERILKLEKDTRSKSPQDDEKKSNSKRRYTDSRHQTRHIPDAEALRSMSTKTPATVAGDATLEIALKSVRSRSGPVWKRREIIASDPKEPETFL